MVGGWAEGIADLLEAMALEEDLLQQLEFVLSRARGEGQQRTVTVAWAAGAGLLWRRLGSPVGEDRGGKREGA